MRLDKYVSKSLQITRNDAKKLISKKQIIVINNDEKIIKLNSDYNLTNEKVFYGDKELIYKENIYIMMNKPQGYVCANYDNHNKTIYDLITDYKTTELGTIGRLDIDTEGLVVITSDGDLIHRITSPKNNHYKKYYVEVDGSFKEDDIKLFQNGIIINDDGEEYKCKEAILEIIDSNKAYIKISEGKFHQIKKMINTLSLNVTYLKRIEIGKLKLDESLKLGEYRELNDEEINLLLNS